MVKVTTFVYCESVLQEVTPQGSKVSLINPIQILTPAFVPTTFSFSVAFGLLGIDFSKHNEMHFKFLTPEKDIIIDTQKIKLSLEISEVDSKLPQNMHGFMTNLDFRNLILKTEGEYESEIYFNAEKIASYPIWVKGVDQI